MQSLTSPANRVKTNRKPHARAAKVQQIGDSTILWLTVGNNITAYGVTVLPHAFGKAAFHLQKADKGDGPGEEYDVLLDGQFSSCECKGFLRHGMNAAGGSGCKHIAGCKAAMDAGQLKAAAVAGKPEVQPEPEPEAAAGDEIDAMGETEESRESFEEHYALHHSGIAPWM